MRHILGIGECMVELSDAGERLWRQGFAGDVFNMLWYARAYLEPGDSVAFHTALGTDPLSSQMLDFFAAAGIDAGDTPRIEGRMPGLYAIHLRDGERSFSYWRDTSAARELARDGDLLAARIAGAGMVYVSGITLAILAPEDRERLLAALEARPGDTRLAFDPNIRERLWESAEAMQAAVLRAGRLADIVLAGVEDEQTCFGDASPAAIAARYDASDSRMVVVKDGAKGVTILGAGKAFHVPAETVEAPVDTTGAGDSFAGAFLASLLRGRAPRDAARLAHACAARVVMSQGALCPHEELPG